MSLGRFDLQGGSNNEMSPSAEAVSEFKMHTGAIGAQYGGGQTAVANFAIRSGTNDLHGTVYDYFRTMFCGRIVLPTMRAASNVRPSS